MKKSLFIVMCLPYILFAQEHIRNGSFEQYSKCPNVEGNMPKYWDGILTPNYYNACAVGKGYAYGYGTPQNIEGYQLPVDGNGYVGFSIDKFDCGEFIQTQLLFPLEKDQKYVLEFYVSKSDYRKISTSSIGAYFTANNSASKRQYGGRSFTEKNDPYLANPDSNMLNDPTRWYKISGSFIAKGKETYLLIGNSQNAGNGIFVEDNTGKKRNKIEATNPITFYYIDCVSLWPVDDRGNKINIHAAPQLASLDSVKAGEPIVLDNIYFETGKALLLSQSNDALDKLANMLSKSPSIKLEISGHTDNTGIEERNKELSESRAKSVTEYLKVKGISSDRVTYKGYGSSKPIANNDTEEGRSRNRRVEFIVLEK